MTLWLTQQVLETLTHLRNDVTFHFSYFSDSVNFEKFWVFFESSLSGQCRLLLHLTSVTSHCLVGPALAAMGWVGCQRNGHIHMFNHFISQDLWIQLPKSHFQRKREKGFIYLIVWSTSFERKISARLLSLVEPLQIGLFHTNQLQALLTYKHSSKKLSWHYWILLNFHRTINVQWLLS